MAFLALQILDDLIGNGCVVFLKNDGQFDGGESVIAFKIVAGDIVGELD
jgi:hypothetical protein